MPRVSHHSVTGRPVHAVFDIVATARFWTDSYQLGVVSGGRHPFPPGPGGVADAKRCAGSHDPAMIISSHLIIKAEPFRRSVPALVSEWTAGPGAPR